MGETRRVVVTGYGVVSSVGTGVDKYWDSLIHGRSGIGPITLFDASQMRSRIAGEVRDFDIGQLLSPKEARRLDRFCHLALGAAEEAVRMAGVSASTIDPERAGVMVSSGIGGINTFEEQCAVLETRGPSKSSPLMVPMMIIDMAAGYLSIRYGFKGPNFGVVTACATASHSIGEAGWVIRRGDADVMLAGGAEAAIVPVGVSGFAAMRALSERNDDPTHASRPFDKNRDGFVIGEGAGVLVLEEMEHARARGAAIFAELIGYGLSGDAYHITAPDPEGAGAARAMANAIRQSGLPPEAVDYVNAHGTSTELNDKLETMALKRVLGAHAHRVAISSTKSMTGHTLGAAGGLESIVCIQALRTGIIPPTTNYETPDPDCDLDYTPNVARQREVRVAMNINLGFGGHNAVLLFRQCD
jgi:3-oxoacyl-[acyl-carrier-protein] synthase II